MTAVIEQKNLASILTIATSVSLKKSPIPTLTHVVLKINSSAQNLTAIGTNFDTWMEVKAAIETNEDAIYCIPAEASAAFVSGLPDGSQVSLSKENDGLRLRCGNTSAYFAGLAPDTFPHYRPNETQYTVKAELPAKELHKLFSRTIQAVNPKHTNFQLCGLHVFHRDGFLWAEGARLEGMMRQGIRADALKGADIILPHAAVIALLRLLPETDETVKIGIDPAWAAVSIGSVSFVTKLIHGGYANYDSAFPKVSATKGHFYIGPWRDAVNRLLNLAIDIHRTLAITFEGETVKIATRDRADSQGEDVVAGTTNGPAQTRLFNGRMLMQMTAPIKTMVWFDLTPADHPQSLNVVVLDPDEPDWRAIVVALRN